MSLRKLMLILVLWVVCASFLFVLWGHSSMWRHNILRRYDLPFWKTVVSAHAQQEVISASSSLGGLAGNDDMSRAVLHFRVKGLDVTSHLTATGSASVSVHTSRRDTSSRVSENNSAVSAVFQGTLLSSTNRTAAAASESSQSAGPITKNSVSISEEYSPSSLSSSSQSQPPLLKLTSSRNAPMSTTRRSTSRAQPRRVSRLGSDSASLPMTTKLSETPAPEDGPSPPRLLCKSLTGRLGNQLFEYASTLGLAWTMKRVPVFTGDTDKFFSILRDHPMPSATTNLTSSQLEERCRQASMAGESSCCKYQERLTRLDPCYDYRIYVYLQSHRYFDAYKARIRQAVTFNNRIRNQSETIVRELRRLCRRCTLIGVHVRHGDMVNQWNKNLGYPALSPDYLNRSASFFSQLFPDCLFVVASDSIDWCRRNFPSTGYYVHFLSGNEPAVDLLVLASLDHAVQTFGTFSWWVGYLNRGRTVYMKDFIVADTRIGNKFNPGGEDYIYPGWIPL